MQSLDINDYIDEEAAGHADGLDAQNDDGSTEHPEIWWMQYRMGKQGLINPIRKGDIEHDIAYMKSLDDADWQEFERTADEITLRNMRKRTEWKFYFREQA